MPSNTPAGPARPARTAPVCETLEGRQLLAADLQAMEITGVIPQALVTGVVGKVPALGVNVTNVGNEDVRQSVSVQVLASLDGAFDDSDIPISEKTINLRLKSGSSKHIPLKLGLVPGDMPQGQYRLLALVDSGRVITEDNEGNNSIATIPSVTFAPPFVDLRATNVTVSAPVRRGRPVRVALTVLNAGNVTARGTGVVNVVFTPVVPGAETPVEVPVKINLKAGKTGFLRSRMMVPPTLAAGDYTVTATITSTLPFSDSNPANNTATGRVITVL